MALFDLLTQSFAGKLTLTALMSMLPVVELRGGIPFGVGLGLPYGWAYCASVVGNMLPVPFLIVYVRRVLAWLRSKSRRWDGAVTWLETRAHLKGRLVTRYRLAGLCILVAIPLPGTGAWTGALVAAFLNMRLKGAVPAIFVGVLLAGAAVIALTLGVVTIF